MKNNCWLRGKISNEPLVRYKLKKNKRASLTLSQVLSWPVFFILNVYIVQNKWHRGDLVMNLVRLSTATCTGRTHRHRDSRTNGGRLHNMPSRKRMFNWTSFRKIKSILLFPIHGHEAICLAKTGTILSSPWLKVSYSACFCVSEFSWNHDISMNLLLYACCFVRFLERFLRATCSVTSDPLIW